MPGSSAFFGPGFCGRNVQSNCLFERKQKTILIPGVSPYIRGDETDHLPTVSTLGYMMWATGSDPSKDGKGGKDKYTVLGNYKKQHQSVRTVRYVQRQYTDLSLRGFVLTLCL